MRQIPHSRPWITKDDIKALENVLTTGMLAQGKLVRDFEMKVAEYNNCRDGFAFSTATAALFIALKALGAVEDREVILPTYVCKSVLDAVYFSGAKPVLVDIGEDTWNITPETVKKHITKYTAAIILVHTFGIPAEVRRLKEFGIPIIEDCAQSFGTDCDGDKAGSIGDIGIYSFHTTKCLATGEGGMVVAKDGTVIEKLIEAKETMPRIIFPLSDLQAAIGLSQLKRYNQFIKRRREIASVYFEHIDEKFTKRLKSLRKGNIFFRFPLYGDYDFEYVRRETDKIGIQVRKGVDSLLHRSLKMEDRNFPNTLKCFSKTLSIPIYPSLEKKDQKIICDNLQKLLT